MTSRQSLETEVKLRIPSLEALRPRMEALGFSLTQPEAQELSVLWDREASLLDQGSALRTRSYAGSHTFTFKGPVQPHPTLKIRPEHETVVSDPEALEALLRALGFAPVLHMEKTREVWTRAELVACLDRTPFGCFLELEGDSDAIRAAMEHLALDASRIERRSYPRIWREEGKDKI